MRKSALGRVPARVAVAALVAAVVVPQGVGTASATSSVHKPPRAKHQRISTAGRTPSSQLLNDRAVTAMLELSQKPAALSFRASLGKGLSAARAASKTQNVVVERQSASVAAAAKGVGSTKVLYRVSRLYSGVAVQTRMRDLPALRKLRGVSAVHVMTAKTISNASSVPLIHAPQQWDSGAAGTGQGVTVGIIDTGIDYTHANFGGPGSVSAYTSAKAGDTASPTYPDPTKVAGGYDFAGDAYDPASADLTKSTPAPDTNPLDCEGHGSHVAGTVGGYGVTQDGATYAGPYNSSVDFTQFKLDEVTKKVGIGPGVAPKATLYALKVFGCEGSTNLVTEALDWAADPNGDGDISDHLDVVNMSLGSDYSSPDDPDAVASNNASLAGVTVVASAGNGGDLTDIAGAPGNATRAISVAATDDGYGIFDGVRVESGSAAGLKVAERSAAYGWAAHGGLTTPTEVVALGNWGQDPSDTNNTDGCAAFSTADKAKVVGKVVLLSWTDNDALRQCGSAGRGANARLAGAIGVVLANDEENFAAGITGDTDIPEEIVVKSAGDALKQSIDNAEHPTVTLRYLDRNSTSLTTTADTAASFTSRGRRGNGGLKPDVAAPGISVFSTAVGTGSEGVSENGTSMAAPHVAGVAALVKAAHKGWTPEEIKAAIMDTALTDVTDGHSHTYGPTRVGTGRVDAQNAASADLLAFTTSDPGAVSLGFGTVRATGTTKVSKTLHVVNKTGSARTIAVSYDAIQAVPGASVSVSPSTLQLDPADGGDVIVTLTLNASALRRATDPTKASTDPVSGLPVDYVTELTGRVQLSESSTVKAQVAVEATPRPATTLSQVPAGSFPVGVTASTTMTGDGSGIFTSGSGGYDAMVSGLELQGVDERLPDCGNGYTGACVPFPSARAGDMRYTAAGSTVPADVWDGFDPYDPNQSASLVLFGVTAWDKWATPASYSEYDVWIDTNNDHKPDFVTYNTRYGASDLMVAETDVLDANGIPVAVADIEPLNNEFGTGFSSPSGPVAGADTAKFDDESLVLPVYVPALGLSSTKHRISWWVQSGSIETGYIDTDASATAPHSFDVAQPGLALSDDPVNYPTQTPYQLFADDSSAQIKVTKSTAAYNADKAQGLWLFHTLNTDGKRAQVLRIKQNQTITVPAAAKVVHNAVNGRFSLNTVSTSGLPVTVSPQTPTTCYLSGGYVVPRAAGVCTVKWTQAGNADFNAASVSANFRVVGESVSTLTTSDSSAPASQYVVLTATVIRKYTTTLPLTGTVTFYDGSRAMGHVTLASNGKAFFRLPALTRGTHHLRVVYATTSAYYTGSASPYITQVVT